MVEGAVQHDADPVGVVVCDEVGEFRHRLGTGVGIAQDGIDLPVVLHGIGGAGVVGRAGGRIDFAADGADGMDGLEPDHVDPEAVQQVGADAVRAPGVVQIHVPERGTAGELVGRSLGGQRIQFIEDGIERLLGGDDHRAVAAQSVVGVIFPGAAVDLPARVDAIGAAPVDRQRGGVDAAAQMGHRISLVVRVERGRGDVVGILVARQLRVVAAVQVAEKLDGGQRVGADSGFELHGDALLVAGDLVEEEPAQVVVRVVGVAVDHGPHDGIAAVEDSVAVLVADGGRGNAQDFSPVDVLVGVPHRRHLGDQRVAVVVAVDADGDVEGGRHGSEVVRQIDLAFEVVVGRVQIRIGVGGGAGGVEPAAPVVAALRGEIGEIGAQEHVALLRPRRDRGIAQIVPEHQEVVVPDRAVGARAPRGDIELGAPDGRPELHAVVLGDFIGGAVERGVHDELGAAGARHLELPIGAVPRGAAVVEGDVHRRGVAGHRVDAGPVVAAARHVRVDHALPRPGRALGVAHVHDDLRGVGERAAVGRVGDRQVLSRVGRVRRAAGRGRNRSGIAGGLRGAAVDVVLVHVAVLDVSGVDLVVVGVAVAVHVAAVVPLGGIEGRMVVGIQAAPAFAVVGDEVVVGIAGPGLVGPRGALVEVRHFHVVGQAVAVGVDVVAAIEIEDHAPDDAAGDAAVHALGFEVVRAVDEIAPEAVGDHAPLVVALDDLAVEHVRARAAVERQLVAVPVELQRTIGVVAAGDRGLEERDLIGGVGRVAQADALRIGRDLEDAHRGAGVDDLARTGVVRLGGDHRRRVRAGRQPRHGELPQALHDLVGGGRRAAVDRNGHAVGRPVRVGDRQHELAGQRLVVRDVEGHVGTVAVDIDHLRGGVENGRIGRVALREGARLDGVETFGEVGGGEGEGIGPARDGLVHVVEAPGHAPAAGIEEVGDRQLDAVAPLEHDVVHRDARGHLGGFGLDGDGVGRDARHLLGRGRGVRAAGDDPRHRAGRGGAFLDGDVDAVGALRRVDDKALAAHAGDADRHLAAADRGRVAVVAGVILQDRAVGERAGQRLGHVVARVVQGQDHDAVAAVEAVGVHVFVALQGEEVAVAFPALLLGAAGEVLVDPDQVGDGAAVDFAERVAVVAGDHPRLVLVGVGGIVGVAPVVFPRDVVARVVHHRHADVAQDVRVGEVGLARVEGLVMPPDIGHAGRRAEVFAEGAEVRQIAPEAFVGRFLHRIVEEAHRISGALAIPVFDLGPRGEDFGKNEGVGAVPVAGEQVGGVPAEIVAAPLGVVPLRLVQEAAAAPAEELVGRVLARIQAQAVVVHRVAEPGDPAVQQFRGVLVGVAGGIVGIAVVLPHVPQIGRAVHEIEALVVGVRLLAGEALAVAVEGMVFRADVRQVRQIRPHRRAVALLVIPPAHARRPLVVQRARIAFLPLHVEIRRRHARVFAEVRPVAVVVHHDVGNDLDVQPVRVVHHGPQRTARAVARGQGAALRNVADVEPVIEIVPHVRPLRAGADGALGGRGNPQAVVADFRHLRQLLVHLVPVAFEPLHEHFRLRGPREGEETKHRQGAGDRSGRFHGHTPWSC